MNTPDVNVLVAASRSDHPDHVAAANWLRAALAESSAGGVVLLPAVVAGFLRIVTHPKVFVKPTPGEHAWNFINALRAHSSVAIRELDTPWEILREIMLTKRLTGNDVPDAWIAAKVRHHHLRLATFDRGFKRLLRPSMLTLLAS